VIKNKQGAEGSAAYQGARECLDLLLAPPKATPGAEPSRTLISDGLSLDRYAGLWMQYHRAEEALLETRGQFHDDGLLGEAVYDSLRLKDSKLPNREALQNTLGPLLEGKPKPEDLMLPAARTTLRTVRRSINEFVDERYAELVRWGNCIVWLGFGAVLVTLPALWLARAGGVRDEDMGIPALLYLVGAVSGLAFRLYSESQPDTLVDDYGVTAARLLTTPFLSGVVALLGVLIMYQPPVRLTIGGDGGAPAPVASGTPTVTGTPTRTGTVTVTLTATATGTVTPSGGLTIAALSVVQQVQDGGELTPTIAPGQTPGPTTTASPTPTPSPTLAPGSSGETMVRLRKAFNDPSAIFWAIVFGALPSLFFNALQSLTDRGKSEIRSTEPTQS
jgi:hypothetical protein